MCDSYNAKIFIIMPKFIEIHVLSQKHNDLSFLSLFSFSSAFSPVISETLQCDKWPNEADKPSTAATPITTNPTQAATTATAEGQISLGNDHVTFPSSTARSSASSTLSLITQLTLIISLVVCVIQI